MTMTEDLETFPDTTEAGPPPTTPGPTGEVVAAGEAAGPGHTAGDATGPGEAMDAGDAAGDAAQTPRPDGVPEKFWDANEGKLRTDALLKSYVELERKLGSMVALPSDDADVEGQRRLRRALGVPEAAEEYAIEPRHELVEPTPEINAKLHEAGFTQSQAQLVYDLAADYVVPMVDQMQADVEAARDVERLAAEFGGKEAWQRLAHQMQTWGKANLSEDVMEVLASSYDGVLAMHQMMQAREPSVLRDGDGPGGEPDEAQLATMMRDPRYWRDRDPAFVAKVTEGFKRLYGG